MVVVIDSGVWVSAFQFGGTPLAAIECAFIHDQIAYCDQILAEVRAVLVRKFSWRDEDVRSVLADYLATGTKARIRLSLHGVCRDPKDDMVFECAQSAQAKAIVSGDRDLLSVGSYQSIYVLTPRAYLERPR